MLRHAHSGSLWLSLALSGSLLLALALSGSLLLSEFAYNILARLTRPLLSSQWRCCATTLSAALSAQETVMSHCRRNCSYSWWRECDILVTAWIWQECNTLVWQECDYTGVRVRRSETITQRTGGTRWAQSVILLTHHPRIIVNMRCALDIVVNITRRLFR